MSADHIQFLKNKFIDEFQEAGMEFDKLPLRSHFQEISEVLTNTEIVDSTPIVMKDWLYDLKYALAECVISAEEEQKLKTQQNKKSLLSTHFAKQLWFLRKTGKKLIRVKKKLQSMKDFASAEIYFIPEQIIVYKQPSSPFLYRSKVHGFDEQIQKIEDLLVSDGDDTKTIGIVGMAGSGKTTLAQTIFHRQRIKQMYSPIIWVQLSKDKSLKSLFSKEAIVWGVINCLTHHYCPWDNLVEMLQKMNLHLHDTKYLIVLDNVIDPCDWYYDLGSQVESSKDYSLLSHGFPRGHGGAIIVTSRNEDLAGKMVGEKNLHRVQPILDNEICWSIFNDSMSTNVSDHETLSRMKDEIVDRCDGLPLAAKTLAKIIRNQIFPEKFWADPRIRKAIRLKLDLGGQMYCEKVKEKVREKIATTLGPGFGIKGLLGGEVVVYGNCNPIEIVRALREFWSLELVSVQPI